MSEAHAHQIRQGPPDANPEVTEERLATHGHLHPVNAIARQSEHA